MNAATAGGILFFLALVAAVRLVVAYVRALGRDFRRMMQNYRDRVTETKREAVDQRVESGPAQRMGEPERASRSVSIRLEES